MSDKSLDDVPAATTPPAADDAPTASEPTGTAGATTEPSTTTAAEPASAPPVRLQRERADRAPSLGGALALGVVGAAALPFAALVVLAVQGASTTSAASSVAAPAATPASATTAPAPGGPDPAALAAAIDAVEREARSAGEVTRKIVERAERAERGARVRATQKLIARARDARRAAGQSGPALKGPFPVAELGDLVDLELSPRRWLITRDGAVVAPVGVDSPAPSALATAGRDEDIASIPATVGGVASTLLRHCVPFEPWCLIDVAPVTPPPPAPAVDVTPLRALLAAGAAVATTTTTTTTTPTTPTEPPPAAPTAPAAGPRPWPLLALGAIGLLLAVVVAARVRQLGTLLRGVTWRLRAGLAGRATPSATPAAFAELGALEAAIDEAFAAIARLSAVDEDQTRRRGRLEAAVTALQEARSHGGVPRLDADDADDAATARVVAAVNALLDTLDARHRRIAMAVTDAEGTLRLVTPLSQRLLRLARLDGLPPQAAEELNSLGTSLGQRARRPQVLPGLLQDLAPLAPPTASIVDVAAAVEPLGDEGARLAARQLEGVARDD